ncbi:MAG: heme ABC transporter ATP-binding protein [Corynebacterium sp.]|uniref:heme ABC transporter ATP-binding protein n=1 Tax=Corynebacterium sp. TaxID=1720 RepID=UPI0026DC7D83|nr:heme ABC transporter ATP-binding protein [Corynebacterium sp.]MDO5030324.1 heme ABC transporter ATP-binding protein [Corynebacterium sp.]
MTEIHSGLGISAQNLSVTLGGHRILHDISIEAKPGEVTALVGPNGAGKSTLLAALSGDHDLSGGDVRIGEQSISELSIAELARYRAVLVQSQELTVPFTSREVIDFGRSPWGSIDEKLQAEVISECDVAHLLDREVPTLSGGERARVHCARVFYQDTPVVLLDEPTAALDLHHSEKIMGMMRARAAAGKAVVVVLHDLSAAAAYADHVVVVAQGRVVKQGLPAETLDAQTVSEVYGIGVEVLHDSAGNPVLVPHREPRER